MIVLFESIATSLQSYGLGTIGSDLFIGQLPSTPYESTVIAPSGGYEISGDKVNRPAVQFLHRSVKYNDGWTYINSLNTLFADKFNKLGCSYPGRFARQSLHWTASQHTV